MRQLNLPELAGEVLLGGELEETLHVLCDELGGRWPGTVNETKAGEYLETKLRDYGLDNVHRETFPLSAWLRGTISVDVISPFDRSLTAMSLPNTASQCVEGEVIFADFSTLEEWAEISPAVRGRIVLCQGHARREERAPIGRAQKARLACEAGAIGFVWVAEREGKVLLVGSVEPDVGQEIPCVTVAREDGALLRRTYERTGSIGLGIRAENTFRIVEAHNIVGEIASGNPTDPIVIAGAHYDGHDVTDGAHDDASGTASMLEAARVLAHYKDALDATVRFVMFTAEEMGVIGSRVYVEQHEDELDNVRFMLNADGVGLSPNEHYLHLPLGGDAVSRLKHAMALYRRPVVVEQGLMPLFWDHEGFALQGVQCGSITDPVRGVPQRSWAHTVADSLDKLPIDGIRRATLHIALILALVANDSDWPGHRLSPDQVNTVLSRLGIHEEVLARRHQWCSRLIARR